MKRLLVLPIVAVLCGSAWAADDAAPVDSQPAAPKSVTEKLKENPDSTDALNDYMMSQLRQLVPQINSAPDEAEKILQAMKTTLNELEPTAEAAKQLLARAKDAVGHYEQQLQMARTSLEDLKAKLNENPEDPATIGMVIQKVMQELYPLASSEPAKAEEQLAAIQAYFEELKGKIESDEAKRALEGKERPFGQLLSAIERAKRMEALIGAEAPPLAVEAWVNGTPLTDEDLKGKVVLLDFWAVWCGPCIATFPHLREWHEKYADKGLVIIGLTNYYNYVWDEAAGRGMRSPDKVTPEQEQEMLQKFAESHDLHHRFAIQKDRSMAEFYGVTGIPHAVLVDREGKVQLMRVGSGEANAKAIEAKIEELIAEGA